MDPVLGLCEQADQTDFDNKYIHQWVRDGDRICMQPKKTDSSYPTSPDGLCLSAKELADGAPIGLAKDFTGSPVDWSV